MSIFVELAHSQFASAGIFSIIVNSNDYNSNDIIFVSIPGKRGDANIRKQQQDITIKEETDRFVFDVYNQVDLKMNIPLSMMKMLFPKKLKEVNEKVIQVLNNK